MSDTETLLRVEESWIEKKPGVCGGRARVRRTGIPVWSLVEARKIGFSDQELLNRYELPLTAADLEATWAYYEVYRDEIEHDIYLNELAMTLDVIPDEEP